MDLNICFLFSHHENIVEPIVNYISPKLVISNNPTKYLYVKKDKNYDSKIYNLLIKNKINLVILIEYYCKIPENIINKFKIINFHYSLLPKYGGKGMYGDNIFASVIGNGERETGITAHLVTKKYDQGKILKQWELKINNDTKEELGKRTRKLCINSCKELIKEIKNEELNLFPR